MIDRVARDRLAEGIRHLVAGQVSNWDFEDRVELASPDPALNAVFFGGPWHLYDDWPKQMLRGRLRIVKADRRVIARWIMFLKTDLPYEWPVRERNFMTLMWVVANLASLGYIGRRERRVFEQTGDVAVWPFFRQSDYDAALARPVYLATPSNQTVDGDAPQAARPSP